MLTLKVGNRGSCGSPSLYAWHRIGCYEEGVPSHQTGGIFPYKSHSGFRKSMHLWLQMHLFSHAVPWAHGILNYVLFPSCHSPFLFFICNFIYFFLAALGLCGGLFFSCKGQRQRCRCSVWASHCGGFSCCGARAPERAGFSSCGPPALEHRLSSCGTCSAALWHVGSSRSGITPAWAGGLSTAEPPAEPSGPLACTVPTVCTVFARTQNCRPRSMLSKGRIQCFGYLQGTQ